MKVVTIDKAPAKVFVLVENDERLVYVPVKALERLDYENLKEIEAKGGDMMREMSQTTLPNGKNALAFYSEVIQVMVKETGERIRKPNEVTAASVQNASASPQTPAEELYQLIAGLAAMVKQTQQPAEEPKPKPRATKVATEK